MQTPAPNLSSLDDVAHVIQVALTPVFLLTGIGTLINVFSTRLARVADQVDKLAERQAAGDKAADPAMEAKLKALRLRSLALDLAVILGALGGAATCGAVVALFVGALRDETVASVLFGLFGFAVLCTIGALMAFLVEMLIASAGLRRVVETSEDKARS